MRKFVFISVLMLSATLFIGSCSDSSQKGSSDSKSVYKSVFKDNGGIIRGLSFDEKIEKVKSGEDASALKESSEDYLSYNYKINNNNSFELDYSFDSQGIYKVEIYTEFEKENAEKFVKKIKDTFIPKCKDIIDKDSLLTMNSKDGKYLIDVDYLDMKKGIVSVKFTVN